MTVKIQRGDDPPGPVREGSDARDWPDDGSGADCCHRRRQPEGSGPIQRRPACRRRSARHARVSPSISAGSARASVTTCIFVVRPPRERPMHPARTSAGPVVSALCAPPSCVHPVLAKPDQGGTHGLLRSVISCRHRVEYTVPDTDPAPPDEPIVAGGAIAVGSVGPSRR